MHLSDCSCAPILQFFDATLDGATANRQIPGRIFGQFFTSLRKDSVANYARIWTLFSPSVKRTGCALQSIKRFVVLSVGGATRYAKFAAEIFQNTKKSASELCQILCIFIFNIVINSIHIMGIHVTISCRYCIAFEVMLLFLVSYFYFIFHISGCAVD